MPELSGEGVKSWTFARLLSGVTDTLRRAPRRFMLWLESVIGTAFWCWWQVPARRLETAGRGAQDAARRDSRQPRKRGLVLALALLAGGALWLISQLILLKQPSG